MDPVNRGPDAPEGEVENRFAVVDCQRKVAEIQPL